MKYAQGEIGRVYIIKIEDGDDLLAELKNLAELEDIEAGIFYLIGAVKDASMVTGSQEFVKPPVPLWRKFDDCRELLGIGTLFCDRDEPVFHLHCAAGKGDKTLVGCIRGQSKAYLVVEVILLEILNTYAFKELDINLGLKILNIP